MAYKIFDSHLKLREYGRNIQMMVDYCKGLEDDGKRNALAGEIVRIMSNINPSVRENPDYEKMLWDHLFHLADYELDVESPFGEPDKQELMSMPTESMPYYFGKPRYRQYGRNVELMIQEALAMEEGGERTALINIIANIMKMHLKTTERDSNAELIVLEHLKKLSDGVMDFTPDQITFYRIQQQQNSGGGGGGSRNQHSRQQGGQKKHNRKKKFKR